MRQVTLSSWLFTATSAALSLFSFELFAASPTEIWVGPAARAEADLRQLIQQPTGPEEIYALLSEGTWGGVGQRALLVFKDHAQLRCDDGNGRTRDRDVPNEELQKLREWISVNKIDQLSHFDEGTMDGVQYQYVHLTRKGGTWRVFMNNPPDVPVATAAVFLPVRGPVPHRKLYGELTGRMLKLDQAPMRVLYESLLRLEGFKIIHAKEKAEVSALSTRENRLIASVFLRNEREFSWYSVFDSGLSQTPLPKEPVSSYREKDNYLEDVPLTDGPLTGKHLLTSWTQGKEGLWIADGKNQPELFAKGIFGRTVIVTPDGNWVVAAKTQDGSMWNLPNGVVRIHVPTRRVFPVDLSAADNFDPKAWIGAHQRVLLHRERDQEQSKAGPTHPEFYLLDPSTGETKRIEGDFRPFLRDAGHSLQATARENEVWALIPEFAAEKGGTAIGRYNTKDFRFNPVIQLPNVILDKRGLWIDEAAGAIWIAVNGDLLRLSLPGKSPPSK